MKVRAENMILTEKQSLGYSLPLKKGNYIRIAVIDQGAGIPEANLDKIFDPFFSTKQEGSGLGLSTVFSILRNHGGHISMQSKIGAGSTFYVYLPASTKTVVTKKTVDTEITRVGKARILVMDDEKMVREVAEHMIENLGYEDIEFASDGEEAIKLYSEAMKAGKPFDVVILDLTIPGGMGGKEAIKKLLEIDPGVKAIVSSGYSNDPIMSDFARYGFSGVVTKPYTIEQLSGAIESMRR
jgi:two-component system cell cycle sensor histidine kinase/response regulator CckA